MDATLQALSHLTVCDSPLATLSCLLKAIAELHSADDLDRGLERVARGLEGAVPFDTFTVWLAVAGGGELELHFGLGLQPGRRRAERLAVGEGAIGRSALERQTIREGSELALPLVVQDRLVGVLGLECRRAGAFDGGHAELFTVLAPNLAVALENASLYRRLRDDERRIAEDLRAAREIHYYLLPRKTPWVPGLQTAVAYEPARDLGGDVYDFLPYGEGRTAIAVGDVAGKGTGAALYGSLAVGMLRGFLGENHHEPAEVLGRLNGELHQLGVAQRFIALAFAVYDRDRRTLTLASSGLPYPLLVRAGRVEEIEVRGLPLGVVGGASYCQREIQLEVGDVVVFLTDGIEEIADGCGEPFGEERLAETVLGLAAGSAREIADGLIEATDRFRTRPEAGCGPPEPYDDRTVLAIKVAG